MIEVSSVSNKRIAKNTVLLYMRTILVMLVALYTSRVVLNTLGVEDYGVYQLVGGVVAMFSVISGALSTAISRFLTYSLGKGDKTQLHNTFSTSIIVQLVIAIVILILCEVIGVWLLNNKLVIPDCRMEAATWVLHCSLLTFVINLISVPFNASIIAHEKMNIFAYIGILEVSLKLMIVYALVISPFDKLISYAVLTVSVAVVILLIFSIYCSRNFEECKGKFVYDMLIFKNMLGFAGWNFITNGIYIFNTQGITMLVNMYFGISVNAARGIATQVEQSVQQFTNNFTTAINPQITKSFASGDSERLYYLVCKGAKFSFFLLFGFSLPIIMETDFILKIWLKIVPDYTALFTRLAFVSAMVGVLGNSCYTACLASGKLKKYTLYTSLISCLVFFLTWVIYRIGGSVESSYYVYIADWGLLLLVKLVLAKELVGIEPTRFLKDVVLKIIPPVLLSIVIPLVIIILLPQSLERFCLSFFVCVICAFFNIYYLGLTSGEKASVRCNYVKLVNNRILKRR